MFLKLRIAHRDTGWINFDNVVEFSQPDELTFIYVVGQNPNEDEPYAEVRETPEQIADMIQAWYERHPGR